MNNQISAESFARLARTLARKNGITVRFLKSATASTCGKVIHLPLLSKMDKETSERLLGYLLHEVGHIKTTNFNVPNEGLTNLFEDHRIEKELTQYYKGGEETLLGAHRPFLNDWLERTKNSYTTTAFGAVSNWLLAYGQKVTMGRNVPGDLLAAVDKDLIEHWGHIQNKLLPFLEQSKYTCSTEQASELSEKVISVLKALKPEDQEKPEANKNDEPNGESEPLANPNENDEPNGESDSEANANDEPNGESDLEKAKEAFFEALSNGEKTEDFSDSILETLKETFEEAKIKGELLDELDLNTGFTTGNADLDLVTPSKEVLHEAALSASSLRLAVKKMAEATTRNHGNVSQRGRQISRRKLSRLALGETKIFSKKAERISIDCAITVALDISGSMASDSRDKKALAAMLGLADAFYATRGSSLRGTVFPGEASNVEQVIPRNKKADQRITGLNARGGTPLLEAVKEAVEELQEQKQQKKVLICITDGAVNPNLSNEIAKVSQGIVVYWVGIGVTSLPFDNAICVDNPNELGKSLLKHAFDLLKA